MKHEKNLKFIEGKWYLDFTFNAKRIRRFGGYTKEQARNTLAKLRIEKLDERLGFRKPGKLEDVPFEKFADDFLETYSKQNKKSWKRDETSIKVLKRFFKSETLQTIGPEKVERYKAKRKADPVDRRRTKKKTKKQDEPRLVSPSTINRELACLKTMFNKAAEWGRIEKSPLQAVKKFKENNIKERILNDAESRRLVECASSSIRPVLIVALNTGMRRSEILSLRWQDVDFIKGFVLVEESKSGKARKVPMNSIVFETLKAMPQNSEYVFFNPGTNDRFKDIKRAFHLACDRAKIKGIRLHDLRHTAASKMIEAGIDLVTVSEILGHSSIQMTMRYVHPTPERKRFAVEKLGQIFDQTRQKVDTPAAGVVPWEPLIVSKRDN